RAVAGYQRLPSQLHRHEPSRFVTGASDHRELHRTVGIGVNLVGFPTTTGAARRLCKSGIAESDGQNEDACGFDVLAHRALLKLMCCWIRPPRAQRAKRYPTRPTKE